jgi:hypothetical protein
MWIFWNDSDKFHDLHLKQINSPPCDDLEEITKGVEEEPLKNLSRHQTNSLETTENNLFFLFL